MTDSTEVNLVPNGNGAQLFFNSNLLEDSSSPLSQGQTCTAQTIDGVGILLTPASDARDYEVTPIDD